MVESEKPAATTLYYDTSQYPFCSAFFDPDITNGLVIQDLVENAIPYSASSSVDYFEVVDGRGALFKSLTLDGSEAELRVLKPNDGKVREFKIFFNNQDVSRRVPISLTKAGLIWLFEENAIPPGFIEVLVNNNGVDASFMTYAADAATPDALHLFVKLPTSSALNSAIYFRHSLASKTTVCFICGSSLQKLEERLQQVFPDSSSALPSKKDKDPFIVFSSIFAEYSTILEYERRRLDFMVRDQEAKTGMGALIHDVSLRASAEQYSDLVKALHTCEGLLIFFARTIEFQASCAEFLSEQQFALNELRSEAASLLEIQITKKSPTSKVFEYQKVRDSLNLSASFQRNRLFQVQSLSRRVQIQLSVVANLISQNDSRASITVAEESTSLALAAARDGSIMKSIAVVTMLFLPGTFISTLFAMPFFHVGAEDEVKLVVDNQWWLYFAVTIPVTLLVFFLWGAWSRLTRSGKVREVKT